MTSACIFIESQIRSKFGKVVNKLFQLEGTIILCVKCVSTLHSCTRLKFKINVSR